jgi:DNA topoisomerase-1
MAAAVLDSTTVDVAAKGPKQAYIFRATGSVVKFPGFLAVYQEGIDDPTAGDEFDKKAPPLPLLKKDEPLDLLTLSPEQHFTQPPPRYTEATLVKELEEQGIGRPSTYAPTIATIQERGYVTRDEKKLVPTDLGIVVSDILVQHFPNIVDRNFTSDMEQELDDIANGERTIAPVLHHFYDPFAITLSRAEQEIGPVKVADQPAGVICEKCGREMVIKLSRYGKFIACPGFPECRNTKPMPETHTGVTCPKCHEGEILERRSKKGRTFYGCNRYPDCDFVLWDRPIATPPCPRCGGLLTERGREGQQIRCSACGYTTSRDDLQSAAVPALARAPQNGRGNGHSNGYEPSKDELAELDELFA